MNGGAQKGAFWKNIIMNPFTTLTSRAVLLPVNNIDTDQIIPARFLKITDKSGLGANLFSDWRYQPDWLSQP